MTQITDAVVQAAMDVTEGNVPPIMLERALTAALPYLQPVDVAAVRKQAFEEGFENGVEQSLDALNAYDDITRNEAEQAIIKLKPDYRALSAEPAQGEQWQRADSEQSVLFYTLRQDGWIKGQPSMVNDIQVHVSLNIGSKLNISKVADTLFAALPAAPTADAGRAALVQGGGE